jgi:hypothetical protein
MKNGSSGGVTKVVEFFSFVPDDVAINHQKFKRYQRRSNLSALLSD